MTKNGLKHRISRVKGLTLLDPWGTRALVDRLDGESVWLWYDGINVPFERSLDALVLAANGQFELDKSDQFAKRVDFGGGLAVTLLFDPKWVPPKRMSETPPRPSWDQLRAKKNARK